MTSKDAHSEKLGHTRGTLSRSDYRINWTSEAQKASEVGAHRARDYRPSNPVVAGSNPAGRAGTP